MPPTSLPLRLLAMFLAAVSPADPQGAPLKKETLQYHVEWRLITAGTAKLEWDKSDGGQGGSLTLQSMGLVSRLFRVNDVYTVRTSGDLCAASSTMQAEEGSKRRSTVVTYDGQKKKADYLERDLVKNAVALAKQTDIPSCVFDVLGGLMKLRSMKLEPKQTAALAMSDGKKSIEAKIEAQERETVKTPAGSFQAMRYEANLFNGQLYGKSGRLFVWVTDDERRLPVQIQMKLRLIGTITVQLEKVG